MARQLAKPDTIRSTTDLNIDTRSYGENAKRRWVEVRPNLPGVHLGRHGTSNLFDGLTRSERTIATLLRTEVIGLNAFLAKVRVPEARSSPMPKLPPKTPGTAARIRQGGLRRAPDHAARAQSSHQVDQFRGRILEILITLGY